jgi:hypothetical protein
MAGRQMEQGLDLAMSVLTRCCFIVVPPLLSNTFTLKLTLFLDHLSHFASYYLNFASGVVETKRTTSAGLYQLVFFFFFFFPLSWFFHSFGFSPISW